MCSITSVWLVKIEKDCKFHKKQYDNERHSFLGQIWTKRVNTLLKEHKLAESAARFLLISSSRLNHSNRVLRWRSPRFPARVVCWCGLRKKSGFWSLLRQVRVRLAATSMPQATQVLNRDGKRANLIFTNGMRSRAPWEWRQPHRGKVYSYKQGVNKD